MKITILGQSVETENGSFEIGRETPLYKLIEAEFWDWIENGTPNPEETKAMYFDDFDAIYDMRQAINAAIDIVLETAEEKGMRFMSKADVLETDFICAFE